MADGNLSFGLIFVLCASALVAVAKGTAEDKSHHLLFQRAAGAQDVLLNSIEEGNFDLNQLLNLTVDINSATELLGGTLGVYYSIPRSVIDIIRPGPLPYGKHKPSVKSDHMHVIICDIIDLLLQSCFFPP